MFSKATRDFLRGKTTADQAASIGLNLRGTTAARPTDAVPGSSYFDSTLGKPVWLKTAPSTWVDATGTAA